MKKALVDFTKASELSEALEGVKQRMFFVTAGEFGGPRDKKLRESVLTLSVLLMQLGTKSELLPDAALNMMQEKIDEMIAGTRGVMTAEGMEVPGAACRERLLQYPDRQVGIMFEHGKTVEYNGEIPKGYEEVFRSTLGDVQTIYLKTIGSELIRR